MNCPKCAKPIIQARVGNYTINLDATPNLEQGTVLVVGDAAMFVAGNDLGFVRRNRMQLHTRHRIYCPNFWKEDL